MAGKRRTELGDVRTRIDGESKDNRQNNTMTILTIRMNILNLNNNNIDVFYD